MRRSVDSFGRGSQPGGSGTVGPGTPNAYAIFTAPNAVGDSPSLTEDASGVVVTNGKLIQSANLLLRASIGNAALALESNYSGGGFGTEFVLMGTAAFTTLANYSAGGAMNIQGETVNIGTVAPGAAVNIGRSGTITSFTTGAAGSVNVGADLVLSQTFGVRDKVAAGGDHNIMLVYDNSGGVNLFSIRHDYTGALGTVRLASSVFQVTTAGNAVVTTGASGALNVNANLAVGEALGVRDSAAAGDRTIVAVYNNPVLSNIMTLKYNYTSSFAHANFLDSAITMSAGSSQLLALSSTTGALLVSRMTEVQRDALTAVNGMILYNTTANKFQGYENGGWANLI